MCFAAPILIAPDPPKAGRSAKFEKKRTLPIGCLDRLQQPSLRLGDPFAPLNCQAYT
jgi:hypothetical protein